MLQDGYSSDKSDYESDQQYEDDLDNNDDPTNQPQLGLHESQVVCAMKFLLQYIILLFDIFDIFDIRTRF